MKKNARNSRHEFPGAVRRSVARRAGYLCSYPGCRIPTIGPRSGADDRTMVTGEASHICAASPGGPRYSKTQSAAERTSIVNAIWLCKLHARAIDLDVTRYDANSIRCWKRLHEQNVSAAQLGSVELTGNRRKMAGGPAYDDILSSIPLIPARTHNASPRARGRRWCLPAKEQLKRIEAAVAQGYLASSKFAHDTWYTYEDICWRRRLPTVSLSDTHFAINLAPARLAVPDHLHHFVDEYISTRLQISCNGGGGCPDGWQEFNYLLQGGESSNPPHIDIVVAWLRDKCQETPRGRTYRVKKEK